LYHLSIDTEAKVMLATANESLLILMFAVQNHSYFKLYKTLS